MGGGGGGGGEGEGKEAVKRVLSKNKTITGQFSPVAMVTDY